eukprot:5431585-Pyramimonas_sp.AAC.1
MHSPLLAWPNFAFYNNAMHSGLTDPLTQRPLVEGLPWQEVPPWDDTRAGELATAAATTKDDMEKTLRGLMP